jgi:hypothetical protein
MGKILKFDKFNESWFKNLTKSFSSLFSSTPFDSMLSEYNIEAKKESDESLHFFHNDKMISKIELDEESTKYPVWNLIVYIYQSETPSKPGVIITKTYFEDQDEQPYGETSLKIKTGLENAVKSLVTWWKTYTKSGRRSNPLFKI